MVAGMFAKTSFDGDRQRLNAALAFGNIKNDYDDYMGTGVPLRNDAELRSFIARYLYRVKGSWFIGAQAIYQKLRDCRPDGFRRSLPRHPGRPRRTSRAAWRVVAYHDSRDNDFKPTTAGW
jgi:hypothetical protein